jgi:hypothetical protein
VKVIAVTAGTAALAALALAGCGGGSGHAAVPTVTHTVTHTALTPAPATPSPSPSSAPAASATPAAPTPAAPVPTATKTIYQPASGNQGGSPASVGANQIIVRFSGSGTQNTASFTTPGRWHLSWAYWGCPGRSNFIVNEYNADGSFDPNGISINELGTGRGPVATFAYGDAGTHYLSVDTEGCSWSLVPVTG